ncbi:MAG: hypothetical protein K8H86_10585 [Ignavibacteriaceae bacterium]|nr:hypothetical protein [Ignavibacteriaceae bacterium]
MNKKIILFLIAALLLSVAAMAQEKPTELWNTKGLSQADMERIFGDLYRPGKVFKVNGDQKAIKEVIINGNKVTTVVYNYGSICKPNTLGGVADLVWQGLGYGYEFGPLAAGEVTTVKPDGTTDTMHIVADSYVLPSQGSYSPDGKVKWGWLPKTGFSDPTSLAIATLNAPDNNGDGKPDSWPERWYNAGVGKYLWPAFLGDQATAPDEEVYFVMDDYSNEEFAYYPFPTDSAKRGLGLDAEVRILQFNNPLAEDIIFLIYNITNASEKDLPRLYFGMQGDPHIGGANNYSDDRAFFIPPSGTLADPYAQRARSMVYAWDEDMSGDGGRKAGYFGWKFLESPTNSIDGRDNDDDGLLDESPYNSAGYYIDGVSYPLNHNIYDVAKFTAVYGEPRKRWSGDEDGDWDPEKDDIGIDGIPPTSPNYPGPDYGEGDGKPSQAFYLDMNDNLKFDTGEPLNDEQLPGYRWAGSEPNFGQRDVSESDQLGLTSFHTSLFGSFFPKDNARMWNWLSSETIDPNQEYLQNPGDNIFNFGTGPLGLKIKESQRFSMAILFGNSLDDLVLNAETSARVLESDYRFAKPPEKPTVTAVAGDGRVTLYWNSASEKSFDPFTRAFDFQGYKIYRSRDYTFADVYTITDANGVPFLGQPLFDQNTGKRAQFDLVDSLSGFHPVEYLGRAIKYYLGNNTGLVHQYVDSTATNGITYYYAVVAYDGGSIKFGVPPSETQAVISRDAITSALQFDVNTVQVTPNPLGSGIQNAEAGVGGIPQQLVGNSTGSVVVKVLDDLKVPKKDYKILFADPDTYSVLDSSGVEESFTSKDTVFVSLSKQFIDIPSFVMYDDGGNVVDTSKYILNDEAGRIRGANVGSLPAGNKYKVAFRYFPVYKSNYVHGEDGNDAFDGMRLFVSMDSLKINHEASKFIVNNSGTNMLDTIKFPALAGNPKIRYRADWEIRWTGFDTTATGEWLNPGDTAISNLGGIKVIAPFTIWNISENVKASYLIFVPTGTKNLSKWKTTMSVVLRPTNAAGATTTYQVDFKMPTDSLVARVYPKNGDVFLVKTKKPFQAGDLYMLNSQEAKFESDKASQNLGNIYVVPNPYVAYSLSENPGRTVTQRGDRELQFRNLPPKCTIRIYTLLGELVQTIEKDDNSSIASWDLLSYESQKIAYGIYIYHVDAPGVGEKIGRLAVIK